MDTKDFLKCLVQEGFHYVPEGRVGMRDYNIVAGQFEWTYSAGKGVGLKNKIYKISEEYIESLSTEDLSFVITAVKLHLLF